MPGLTIRRVLAIVREFLDEMKKSAYFFDLVSIDIIDGEWEVECEVVNYPEDDTIGYLIVVDDATGDVTAISRQEGDVEDTEDGDEEEEEEGVDKDVPAPFSGGNGTGGWPS